MLCLHNFVHKSNDSSTGYPNRNGFPCVKTREDPLPSDGCVAVIHSFDILIRLIKKRSCPYLKNVYFISASLSHEYKVSGRAMSVTFWGLSERRPLEENLYIRQRRSLLYEEPLV